MCLLLVEMISKSFQIKSEMFQLSVLAPVDVDGARNPTNAHVVMAGEARSANTVSCPGFLPGLFFQMSVRIQF